MPIQFDQSNSSTHKATLTTPPTQGTFTFPTATPTAGQYLTADGSGGSAWSTPTATGAPNITLAYDATFSINSILANTTSVNGTLSLVCGQYFSLNPTDGTATGGNVRGNYAVDLQLSRASASQVAGGDYSGLYGGYANTTVAGASYSSIFGGQSNVIYAPYSTIMAGDSNTIYGTTGFNYIIAATNSTAGGSTAINATGCGVLAGNYGQAVTTASTVQSTGATSGVAAGKNQATTYRLYNWRPYDTYGTATYRLYADGAAGAGVESTSNVILIQSGASTVSSTVYSGYVYYMDQNAATRKYKVWFVEGHVQSVNNTLTLLGNSITLVLDSGVASAALSVTLDTTTTNYLKFLVQPNTGMTAGAIAWTNAVITTVEAVY
tara:strand:+ start:20569 stop:21705 length:1137 start_codon:yes stop_codon:yes gene_type:complete